MVGDQMRRWPLTAYPNQDVTAVAYCSSYHRHQTCTGVRKRDSANNLTEVTTNQPPAPQWTPRHPVQLAPRSRSWPLAALAGIGIVAIVLSAAALIVALTRPTSSSPTAAPATTASPPYTPAETAAAHQKLCDVYKLAAREVQIHTSGDNQPLAVAATVNGAVMLEQAIRAAPALAPADRAAALALAESYTNANAVGSFTSRDDPAGQALIDDVIAKDARMKALCGAG
ncbi:hypothetical protein LAUMK7_03478 [Mycobacterium kansasii]|nr:hypothetical protein MKAN_01930 [Mycobacterium kansasii ATCC 12478]GFP48170.1 hypothetical protein MKANGN_20480 [Mycobacterium kansasii]VAZ67379.1 hypothetical protein LAUMK40_03518 [Mycobacterium kansasii]VAZ76648.1 hypothetical protein LAUMK7_03478 [Mycobacterium kansasii]